MEPPGRLRVDRGRVVSLRPAVFCAGPLESIEVLKLGALYLPYVLLL